MSSNHLIDLILYRTNRVPGQCKLLDFEPLVAKFPGSRAEEFNLPRQPVFATGATGCGVALLIPCPYHEPSFARVLRQIIEVEE